MSLVTPRVSWKHVKPAVRVKDQGWGPRCDGADREGRSVPGGHCGRVQGWRERGGAAEARAPDWAPGLTSRRLSRREGPQ